MGAGHAASMPTHERASDRGRYQASRLVSELGSELREARLAAGVSQAAVGRAAGVSHSAVSRLERGTAPYVSLRRLAVVASVVGLRLSVRAYPAGLPLRDAAQISLLNRLRRLIAPSLGWTTEVPLAIAGDLRAWDAAIHGDGWSAYVDAETRLRDAQALERRIALKRRDTATDRVILLVADTRTNRLILRSIGSPLVANALPSDEILDALRRGRDPGGSGVLLL
jgi:transcriptional regulator with XRE-family HTH domain